MIALDKLVALHCRAPDVLKQLSILAYDDSYASTLREVEQCAEGDLPYSVLSPAALELHKQIGDRGLLDIFMDDPKLSDVKRDDLLTLMKFADVQPDSKSMFRTEDPVFMRLADASKQGPVIIEKLILDDLCQLAMLAFYFPEPWFRLLELAEASEWTKDTLAIERFLSGSRALPDFSTAASFATAVADLVFPDSTPVSSILLTPPRLSAMLPEAALALESLRPHLPDPASLIDKRYTTNPSPIETGRMLAKHAWERLPEEARGRIAHGYTLRRSALRELTRRRIFVKRDILEHLWPNLYDLMQRDFAGLLQFEKQILQPDNPTGEEFNKLRPYIENERLVRVFKLQPYFGHLDGSPPPPSTPTAQFRPDDLMSGVPVAPQFPGAGAPGAPSQPKPTEAFPASPKALDQPADNLHLAVPPVQLPTVQYEDIHILLEREPNATDGSYSAVFKRASDDQRLVASGITLDWDKIHQQVQRLPYYHQPQELTRAAAPDFLSQLKRLGLMVFDSIFKEPIRHELVSVLESSRNVRLNWLGDPSDIRSAVLPWESLFVPSVPLGFLALTRKYSLARRYVEAKSTQVFPIGDVVRVLFVSASPELVAPLPGIEQEVETLRQVLNNSKRGNLRIIKNATVEDVQTNLREFSPHIFHFSGHGRYNPDTSSGELIFEKKDGTPHLVSAENLALMLNENEVSLALLNGCDTGVSSTNDALSSMAGALVRIGVPAVVATMREVMDEAASRFSREFYRSFVAGFTVEGCIGEARKALSLDNWDWSSYALFVGSADLSRFRLSGSVRSEQ